MNKILSDELLEIDDLVDQIIFAHDRENIDYEQIKGVYKMIVLKRIYIVDRFKTIPLREKYYLKERFRLLNDRINNLNYFLK